MADRFAAQLPPGVALLESKRLMPCTPLAAYLGALRAGVPVILQGVASLLSQCPPDAQLCARTQNRFLAAGARTARLGSRAASELAVLLSTSGSTGAAKLVRLSGANLEANAKAIAEYLGLRASDRAVTTLHPSYSFGLSILNSHLERRRFHCPDRMEHAGRGVQIPDRAPWRDQSFRRALQFRIDGTLRPAWRRAPSIRMLTQAERAHGARRMVKRVAALCGKERRPAFVMYGQTEATARMAYLPPDQLAQHPDCIGRIIPGGRLWIERQPMAWRARGRRRRTDLFRAQCDDGLCP